MRIELATGRQGTRLLRDVSFADRWQSLYEQCPWATAFQSPAFVQTWFDVYADRFAPVVLYGLGPGESLDGLLTLAVSSDSGTIEIAGTDRAEYQVWLARQDPDARFITLALEKLRRTYPGRTVVFQYLPPRTPTAWVAGHGQWKNLCGLEHLDTPVMSVTHGEAVSASRRKKTARSLGRLQKAGATRFERLERPDELESVIDDISAQYDFRQSAVNNYEHFRADPLRKAFQLALMRTPGLLHTTVLRHRGEAIAANLGLCGKGVVHLGIFSHSPACAKESPGKLLLVLLGDHLADSGGAKLDLTPGDDAYKRAFANGSETVYRLTVYPGQLARRHASVRRAVMGFAKRGLRAVGVDPRALRQRVERVRRAGFRPMLYRTLSRLKEQIWSRREMRIYSIRAEHVRDGGAPRVVRRDRLPDLLAFDAQPGWSTREEFLSRALTRLQNGHHVYTHVEQGRLVHYGWMGEAQQHADLSEVGQQIALPPGTAVLYEYFTHPEARGRRLYQHSLRQMLEEAAAAPDAKWIYIWVLADNAASRHVIEKAGFEYRGSACQSAILGRARRWSNFDATSSPDAAPMPLGEPLGRGIL
jgi:CelD/BcsL family acetyltransferase involved in cellulose biosynthesis/RimJ/RimL family protein N-acetyltransferase